MMGKLKTEEVTQSATELLADAKADLQQLAEEMGSWRDNMDGTPLENTSKFESVSEAADVLGDLANRLEDVELPEAYVDLEIRYKWAHPYGRHIGRSWLAGQVSAALQALAEALEELEAKDVVDDLQDISEELQGIDFPGMY